MSKNIKQIGIIILLSIILISGIFTLMVKAATYGHR